MVALQLTRQQTEETFVFRNPGLHPGPAVGARRPFVSRATPLALARSS